MRLSAALGFPDEESWGSARAQGYAIALRLAEGLHRSRVRLTLSDVAGMTDLEREILARAAERVDAERALRLAAALGGREEEVLAALDGGEALLVRQLSETADEIEAALDRGRS